MLPPAGGDAIEPSEARGVEDSMGTVDPKKYLDPATSRQCSCRRCDEGGWPTGPTRLHRAGYTGHGKGFLVHLALSKPAQRVREPRPREQLGEVPKSLR